MKEIKEKVDEFVKFIRKTAADNMTYFNLNIGPHEANYNMGSYIKNTESPRTKDPMTDETMANLKGNRIE